VPLGVVAARIRAVNGFDLERGTYETPRRAISAFAGCCPSLSFYGRFTAVVTSCSNMAKRGVYDDERWEESSHLTRRSLEQAGVRIRAEGLDHVRDLQGPAVFVGNHMSMLETVVLPGFIRPFRPVTYVVKDFLVQVPVFKHIMISRDPIVVTRTDPRADLKTMMEGGMRRLANGISIIVFPQTTRTLRFDRREFNSIGAKLAKKAGVPVVPVALRTDAWGLSKRFVKDFGRIDPSKPVRFAFGEPMTVTGRGAEQHERCLTFIEEHLEAWGLPPVRVEDAGT